MSANPVWRIRLLSFFLFALLVVIFARLFFLQIVKHSFYLEKTDRQYQQPSQSLLDRGIIFFHQRDGNLVSAATMQDGFLATLNPSQIKDGEEIYEKLSTVLTLDHDSFLKKATKPNDPYEEIPTRLNEAIAKQIKSWNLAGLGVRKTRWRFYPGERTAAHVLGLVNRDGVGTYGLEKYYDDLLKRDANKSFFSFFSGALSDFGGSLFGGGSKSEGDLVLTIEPTVENTLEKSLAEVKEKWQAEAAGGIIMDPKTGEVLAMAALPDFDPGAKQESLTYLANPLVERTYEMGSTFKPLTMAAALDAGVVKATTTYNDLGVLDFPGGQEIKNYDGRARGVVPMQEVLNQSLNTGAVFAMQKLGPNRFRDYMVNYGLTEKTDIDLPNEVLGLTKNLFGNHDVEYATASFGQGITVTPVAMARALAVLANGGELVRPYVVAEIDHRDTGLSIQTKPEVIRRVIKPETSKEITRMLVEVVDKALLGGQYKMDKYSVAAKTGTAQQVKPGGTVYDEERYLHSFFGYFPASKPQFLVLLYLIYPKNVLYASHTLVEPFMALTKFLLNYYNVPPDR